VVIDDLLCRRHYVLTVRSSATLKRAKYKNRTYLIDKSCTLYYARWATRAHKTINASVPFETLSFVPFISSKTNIRLFFSRLNHKILPQIGCADIVTLRPLCLRGKRSKHRQVGPRRDAVVANAGVGTRWEDRSHNNAQLMRK
jgi:hypothetical protein